MNENRAGLEQMLERATAANDAAAGELNQEGEALREAWVEFGRLLEAANPAESMSAMPMPAALPQSDRWSPFAAVLTGVLAATVMIGIGLYWMWRDGATGNVAASLEAPVPQASVASSEQSSGAAAWDDVELDQQVARVQQGIAAAQSTLSRSIGDIDLAGDAVRQAQQELENSKL